MADTTGFDWNKFLELAIPAAATGVSGYLGYKGATGAAKTQTQAANDALEFQKQMFATQQANLAPYLATGRVSLNALMRGMGLAPFTTAGPNAPGPYSPDSPFGSRLLGQIAGVAPSATKTGIKSGIEGAIAGGALGAKIGAIGGPLGMGIGAGVGTLSSLFGRGRKEADQLVPIQNAVAAEVDRITKAVNSARQAGTLTKEQLQEAHDAVKGLQSEFGDVAKKFGRAGPGGVETLAKYFDPMTAGWKTQIDSGEGLASGSPAQGAPNATPGASPDQPQGIDMGYFTKPFSTSDFVQDPGYQGRLEEGQKQLDRFFASRGLATSGGAAKSAARYGQTFASNEFQNVYNRYQQERANTFNRLATLAGIGQTAQGTSAGLSSTLAQTGAGLMTDAGAATAAGQVGGAQALSSAATGGANLATQALQLRQIQDYLRSNRLPVPGTPPYNPGEPGVDF